MLLVILVNVVHLRDPVCPLPTSILAQYLKQASGQLSCLKINWQTEFEFATDLEQTFLCRFQPNERRCSALRNSCVRLDCTYETGNVCTPPHKERRTEPTFTVQFNPRTNGSEGIGHPITIVHRNREYEHLTLLLTSDSAYFCNTCDSIGRQWWMLEHW
uniref:Uncharacterized protein n=1 Tax=Anopheles maculatus TaxID=74869 RepID=A0A182SX39_9DIPT